MPDDYAKQIKDITGITKEEFIKLWKDRDKDFTSGMKHNEEHGLKCLKMLIGEEQWDKNLAEQRRQQKRPMLSENLLPDFINKAHGEFCQTTPAANVEPLDDESDPKVADVIKGIIYNVNYQSESSSIHQDAFYNLIGSALAAWGVSTKFVDKNSFEVEPQIRPILNQFSVRWDLSAVKPDLRDKKWCMLLDTMTKEEFKKEYGEENWKPKDLSKSEGSSKDLWWAENKATVGEVWWIQEDEFTLYEQPDGTTSRTKPEAKETEDGRKFKRRKSWDKKVWSCVISGTDILTEPTEWPDPSDEPIIPIIIVYGRKIVVAGKVHFRSLISDGLTIQQIHNFWITTVTEAMSLQPDAPYVATVDQVAGLDEWTDLSKKVRVMRYKHDPHAAGPPQRQSPPQISQAVMGMPQYTKQSLRDVIGMQQASLGMQSNEKSGVAIQKRKQEGDTGKFSFVNNMSRGISLQVEILKNIAPKVIDTPRAVRTMGPDGSKNLVYVNGPDPKTGEIIDLSKGKYDTTVTMGPQFNTQRDEARDALFQLLEPASKINPQGVAAIFPKIVKMLNIVDAAEIAKIFIATLPPNLQAFYAQDQGKGEVKIPPEMMAQIQGIQQKLMQAQQVMQQQAQEIQKLQNEERVKLAEIQGKQGIEKEKIQVEREKIMKEIRVKEMDIESRKMLELEKINATIELELTKLMEGFNAQRELRAYEASLKQKEVEPIAQPPETAGPETPPAPEEGGIAGG